jgi:hypothetical protein
MVEKKKISVEVHEYEEYHEWSELLSWGFILFISASLITVMMIIMEVRAVSRQWDFGQMPFTPSESIYSSFKTGTAGNMIQPLPEGVTLQQENNPR